MVKVLTALVILCLSAVPISAEVAMETVWEMNREQNDVVTSVHADHDRFGLDLGVGAYGHWESSDGLGLYVDELGLSYRGDRLLLSGGLLHHSMGQARLNEVFLSKSSPAFPSVRYDLGGDTWSYTKMLGACAPTSVWSTRFMRLKSSNELVSIISAGSQRQDYLWDLARPSLR